jgi:hypothetical protein
MPAANTIGENRMAMGRREKDIPLLVAKFVKLVESLNPGERLSIKKVAAKPRLAATTARAAATKSRQPATSRTRKAAVKVAGKRQRGKLHGNRNPGRVIW